jgi:hypothetical protein
MLSTGLVDSEIFIHLDLCGSWHDRNLTVWRQRIRYEGFRDLVHPEFYVNWPVQKASEAPQLEVIGDLIAPANNGLRSVSFLTDYNTALELCLDAAANEGVDLTPYLDKAEIIEMKP